MHRQTERNQSKTELQIYDASELHDLPLSRVWRFPRAHLSNVIATPGTGLTAFAVSLCAHIAPTGQPPLDPSWGPMPLILYVAGRETPECLRNRLLHAGADLSRIIIVHEVLDREHDTLRRPTCADLHLLSEVLHEYKSIELIIFDNAEDLFFTPNRPSRNRLLKDLTHCQMLAEKRGPAILFLTSTPTLTKNPYSTSLLSAMHSVCRTSHILAADPHSPDHHLLFCAKDTLCDRSDPIRQTARANLAHPEALALNLAFLPDLTYEKFLAKPHRNPGPTPAIRSYAAEVLLELLKSGEPIPVGQRHKPAPKTLNAQLQQAGLSLSTVLRAKEQLNIITTRKKNRWYWQLVQPIAQPLEAETLNPRAHPTAEPESLPEIPPVEISNQKSELENPSEIGNSNALEPESLPEVPPIHVQTDPPPNPIANPREPRALARDIRNAQGITPSAIGNRPAVSLVEPQSAGDELSSSPSLRVEDSRVEIGLQ